MKSKNNIDSIDTFSPTFAYILGTVYGDGHTRTYKFPGRTGGEVCLKVKDSDFALAFKDKIEEWSKRKVKMNYYRGRYGVHLYSKNHAEAIKNFEPEKIFSFDTNSKHAFLRGLFDSDGGIVGDNLDKRRKAKRWLHFYNNEAQLIFIVKQLLREFGLRFSVKSRVHSGFGSKKVQYEIKIYHFKDIFYYYKNIGFSIQRKQQRLNKVIDSYNYYSKDTFNKARELHQIMGFRKVAKELNVPENVVYRWLFKNYQEKIVDIDER